MARNGFNFRATSGYVTDASGDIYVLITDAYPTTRGGVTFGWETVALTGAQDNNNGIDARLAGDHFTSNAGSADIFRIDLTGSKKIRLAAGRGSYGSTNQRISVRDNTTEQFNMNLGNTSGSWRDAAGSEYSAANWPGSNAQSSAYTFSTSIRVYVGGTGSDYTLISHIEVEDDAGGGSGNPWYYYAQQG